jgi:hypothetical protein
MFKGRRAESQKSARTAPSCSICDIPISECRIGAQMVHVSCIGDPDGRQDGDIAWSEANADVASYAKI